MRFFSKDVEGSLLFQELSLQTVATCRGRQILPCQSGAHVYCRWVMAESAAGAQAGPHACKHTDTNKSHTRRSWPVRNATDVHMLSNKLRLNDEQDTTCKQSLHAQQYNRDYVKKKQKKQLNSLSSPTKQWPRRIRCVEILEAEVVGIFLSKSTSLQAVSLNTSMQYLPNSMNHYQEGHDFSQ